MIGVLETPGWQEEDNTVCAKCHAKLSSEGVIIDTECVPMTAEEIAKEESRKLYGSSGGTLSHDSTSKYVPYGQKICHNPNCGHVGTLVKKRRGSLAVMLLLLLFGVVLWGLSECLIYDGVMIAAARCGMKLKQS